MYEKQQRSKQKRSFLFVMLTLMVQYANNALHNNASAVQLQDYSANIISMEEEIYKKNSQITYDIFLQNIT